MAVPSYHNFEWRLDVELASRSTSGKVRPSYVMRLDTTHSDTASTTASVHLQSDFANMERLRAKLQAAAAELQAPHAKRIVRYIR